MAVRLMIVDDHSIVRQSLRMFFESDPEIEVVGEAANGADALRIAGQVGPEVVLMDLLMPVMDGITATAVMRREMPQVEIVATTSVLEAAAMPGALEAGAIDYVFKTARLDELRTAIVAAGAGQVRLSAERMSYLTSAVHAPTMNSSTLTEEEKGMLRLLAQGRTNRQIAEAMNSDEATIKTQVWQLLQKLRVPSRLHAAFYAIHLGLLQAESPTFEASGS